MSDVLLVRADASPDIGRGHVMRCLALAQRWRRTGPAVFAAARCTPMLERRLQTEGFIVRKLDVEPGTADDIRLTAATARELGARRVVLDGYSFGASYQRRLRADGLRLLFLDDYGHADEYSADLVLNGSPAADARLYEPREAGTRLLLGPRYVMLRDEILKTRVPSRETPRVARNILVTLGGADHDNVTSRVVESLAPLRDVDVVIVAGADNPHQASLQAVMNNGPSTMRLVVGPENLPELMAEADVAVAAGGVTALELAYLGTPSLLLTVADNQSAQAAALARAGAAISLGDWRLLDTRSITVALKELLSDADRRDALSRAGRALVTGLGTQAIVGRMKAGDVALRRADERDARTLWEWANDPAVRATSFSSDPIPWDEHRRWFQSALTNPRCSLYIATVANDEIGPIRFEQTAEHATVSVSLATAARGRDLGTALIVAGVDRFFAESDAAAINAFIKPENLPSVRAFAAAGFREVGPTVVRGWSALHFVLRREER